MSRRSNGDRDTVGYVYPKANGDMKIVRRKCMRDPETDYCLLDSKGEKKAAHHCTKVSMVWAGVKCTMSMASFTQPPMSLSRLNLKLVWMPR